MARIEAGPVVALRMIGTFACNITGYLKLAYSQYEELENYARFGTRLDEHTLKIITYGKRIRAWLQHQELHPLTVPEQMILLIALTNHLFDSGPLDKMQEAEAALKEGMKDFSGEMSKQLLADMKLGKEIAASILALANKTLGSFRVIKKENENNE